MRQSERLAQKSPEFVGLSSPMAFLLQAGHVVWFGRWHAAPEHWHQPGDSNQVFFRTCLDLTKRIFFNGFLESVNGSPIRHREFHAIW